MLLKVLAAGQSQVRSLWLSNRITLTLCYVYEWKELDNDSWICSHLRNSIDQSFPTRWNATLALIAIDKTVYPKSMWAIVFCSPIYCSHMLYPTWTKMNEIHNYHTHRHTVMDRHTCSNFLSSAPFSHHKCENLIITTAHNHFSIYLKHTCLVPTTIAGSSLNHRCHCSLDLLLKHGHPLSKP